MEATSGGKRQGQRWAGFIILAGLCFIASISLGPTIRPAYATNVVITQQCSLSADTVSYGDTLTATGTLQNQGTSSVTLPEVVLAGRPPQGTNAGGPYDDFAPQASNVTIAPGAGLTLTATRSFITSDPVGAWWCYLTFETSDRVYHDGLNTTFTVVSGRAAAPVAAFGFSPSSPGIGQ